MHRTIVWDAGHGGRDPGHAGRTLVEKDVTLDLVRRVRALGVTLQGVIRFRFTRTADVDLAPAGEPFSPEADREARRRVLEELGPPAGGRRDRLAVSFHVGSGRPGKESGFAAWYNPQSREGRDLAHLLLQTVLEELYPDARPYWIGAFGSTEGILRDPAFPAVVLQCGFLSHPEDEALLTREAVRQRIAEACVLAATRFLGVRYVFPVGNRSYQDLDLTAPSGITATELALALRGSPLAGLAPTLLQAERETGVSAHFLAAHAIVDSAWGTSDIARHKRNLLWYGAEARDPFNTARAYPSWEDGLLSAARELREQYLNPESFLYHGPTLRGLSVRYRPDPSWRERVADAMERIRPFAWRRGPRPACVARNVARLLRSPAPARDPATPSPGAEARSSRLS